MGPRYDEGKRLSLFLSGRRRYLSTCKVPPNRLFFCMLFGCICLPLTLTAGSTITM